MAIKVGIEVETEGLEKLERGLARILNEALAASMEYIKQSMRRDVRVRTGRLRDSITASIAEGGRFLVGPTVPYAVYVEARYGLFRTGERLSGWMARHVSQITEVFNKTLEEKVRETIGEG